MGRGIKLSLVLATALLALKPAFALSQTTDSRPYRIAAQTTSGALLAFARESGIQVIFSPEVVAGRRSPAISGILTPEEALSRLLAGTGLIYEFTESGMLAVREQGNGSEPTSAGPVQNRSISIRNEAAAGEGGDNPLEEIVSIGTRSKGRTSVETPVPVDVVNATALASTGQTEVGRMLQVLAPSFNFSSSSVSDGTDALRPATLRGLGPDQTLVLVNGKRRHTGALVHVNTSVGRGTAGVDMNAIPGSALQRIEVLRDGAAAQYGSDAIAGVINLVLKDGAEGGEANLQYGHTYEGDGATLLANANLGFRVGDGGFFNVTAEYRDRGDTNRAGLSAAQQYPLLPDGSFDPREFTFERQNFRIGDADSEQYAFVANAEVPINDAAHIYAFGTYSDRQNQSAGFYRRANQTDRTVLELYPDGFLPLINTIIEDYSLSGGIAWALDDGWSLDFSVNHGSNSFQFVISNSLNASFGSMSPTRADAGTLGLSQTTFNLDMLKAFDAGGTSTTMAFGAEYREENYTLEAGEPVSYQDGGAVNPITGETYASGFQVFRGFSPANEVDEVRHNVSLYAEIETELSERFLITAAGRFEDYSDFGSTLTGKLSSRLDVTDGFAARASISTGFRAPSMQQRFFNSVSTQFVEIDGVTVAQERGTFRNDSMVARLAGVPELKEETSFSVSAGFVATAGPLIVTADYYHIEIDDRIGISGAIDLTQPGFEDVGGAASSGQFFVNAADTVTNGVDLVATYDVALQGQQTLKIAAAANWTKTNLKDSSIVRSIGGVFVGPLFTPQDISIIEEWQPRTRINFSADYSRGPWSFIARVSQFGSYTVCEGTCSTASGAGQNMQEFGAKWLTDLQINYDFEGSGLSLAVGANNLFDVFPDRNLIGQSRGGTLHGIITSPGVFRYSRRSAPFGFNGGFWYGRLTYRF